MYTVPKEYMHIPGGLVYMDVKHLTLYGSVKAYQFTAIDHATRKLFVHTFSKINSINGMKFLQEIEKKLHVTYLGTDNGSEFLGKCDAYCTKSGIKHVFSSPHSPKQNPFIERAIQTIINDLYIWEGTQITGKLQQERLDKYLDVYNNIRPHESLNMLTPNEQYDILSSSICSPS